MQLFQWDQAFETRSAIVDEQHQHLVTITNQFGALIARNASGTEEIEKLCSDLMEYANYHFEAEERFMETKSLDQRHMSQHRQQHEDLRNEIIPLLQLVAAGNLAAANYMFEFLVNWLVFHILGTDMLMASQIEAIDKGMSAEEAYTREEKNNHNTNTLLLTAVKKLLYQISSRNRQLVDLNESLEQRVQERTLELSAANNKLKEVANTDSLTGIRNRRAFMEEARVLSGLAKRHRRPLSFLMIDIDFFKRVNDTYGHQVGDQVLIQLSRVMAECLRGTDILGRIGGEEFAVILPETGMEQTAELTERLLDRVRSTTIEIGPETTIKVTVSIGVATAPPLPSDIDALIKEADTALYNAKTSGRDRCCHSL
ncbi:MAG: GGDEF domain-containing protein [Desulfuromonadales bacterium]